MKKVSTKAPYYPSICEIGYVGVGNYSKSTHLKIYKTWYSMFIRSYNLKYHEKFPTYIGCSVDGGFHCLQDFGKWFEENWKPWMDSTWHLDKDILIKGNKVYSAETCCFIPREINYAFTKTDKFRGKYPIGVTKNGKRFEASCERGANKNRYIGRFDTPEEAFQAYKIVKESYIKELADKWKPFLTEVCYQALYNYQVEITD